MLIGAKPFQCPFQISRLNAHILYRMADFNQGHIIGAINIPSNGFASQLKQLERHKAKPIIVSCRSGAQSAQACAALRKAGFEKVHNLRGGILAWQSANLPVTRK